MKSISSKLKKYQAINKGVISPMELKSVGKALKMAASIPVIAISALNSASAQCTNAVLSGVALTANSATGVVFDVNSADGAGNDFRIFENPAAANHVRFEILNANIEVLGNTFGGNIASAVRVTGMTTAPGAGQAWVGTSYNNLYLAYGNNGISGEFGNGATGNVIFRNASTGALGFFELTITSTGGNNFTLNIPQGGLSTVTGMITPGDCATLALPVELIAFEAMENEKAVDLIWKTVSETENAGFEIQRSSNGRDFESLGFVEGKGTVVVEQEYDFKDQGVKAGKLYYYRLKQIDFNGQFDYSEVKTVQLQHYEAELSEAYPSPNSDGKFSLDFNTLGRANWTFTLFDVAGKLIATEERNIASDSSTQSFDMHNSLSGTYFLKIESGQNRFYKKIIFTK